MIARIWRGAVLSEDSDAYADYMQDPGVAGYARTPGNRGVWMLRRDLGDRTEFVMFTLWDSIEAIKARAAARDDPQSSAPVPSSGLRSEQTRAWSHADSVPLWDVTPWVTSDSAGQRLARLAAIRRPRST
jgi:hypothetical protein